MILRQRRSGPKEDLTGIISERSHDPVNVPDNTSPLNGESLVFAQAAIGESAETACDVFDPRIDIVGEPLDRQRRIADPVDGAFRTGGAKEALGGRHDSINFR